MARNSKRPPSVKVGNESFPIFAARKRIDTLIAELGNPYVIVAMDSLVEPGNQKLINHLLATQINLHIVPAIRGLPLFGTKISHFFSHEVIFLTVRNNLAQPGYAWFKRSFDIVVACLLLILLFPLFLLLSFLIRRDGSNAFYGHTRIGRNGKPFQCLKFRSMRMDADKVLQELLARDTGARAEWEKDFKLKNDPRITPVGRFLRKTSLDELPQLINVIKGEMSLVGPRPVVSAELERYGDYARLYLQVLPGITGLWQVSGRNDTSYNERVSLDAWYVQNWSIWYDIAVLFKTINVVLNQRGAY
ncbi:undecaprenyl-phosphate galactose phosphotransferase WbaP [Methylococcus sp. ANG]|uniref:undecaprenyl-phosphate galactose phosphotransferase WbaP n=1 Tax=Methylococcus sp. ANG TaxID=3231903 RepID=UPI003459494A